MVVGELPESTDVLVIGGGPGGYNAAIRAAQLGLDVTLVEKNALGGVCTNVGCIPSKALIHAASVYHDAGNSGDIGILGKPELDMEKMQEWKSGVVSGLVDGIEKLCKNNGVNIVKGTAGFTSSKKADIKTSSGVVHFDFDNAIIATGTGIRELENLPYDHDKVIDSDDALALDEIPGKLLIVGGGYIAAEMASLYALLGSKVTIIYRGKRLIRKMDHDLGTALRKGLDGLGINIIFDDEVKSTKGRTATLKSGKKVKFDKLLLAVGRIIDHAELGLENTKVRTDEKDRIMVDASMRTSDKNIYAVGDVAPGPQLAHKAFREGKVASEAIAGKKSAFDNRVIPSVVFSSPNVASAGMTEDEAKEADYNTKTGRFPFSALGRARAMEKRNGFVKVVASEDDVVLGVHIAGPGADSMIAEAALAIEMGALLEDLALTIHAHPTMPEALAESAEDALGKAIHIYRKK
jgi:dihydrolipoamide dehydrogenase